MSKNKLSMPQRHRDLFFQTLQLLRKAVTPRFYDWKDADGWLFGELDFTKSDLAQIFEGRGVPYYDGSAINDKAPERPQEARNEKGYTDTTYGEKRACAAPLSREELILKGGRPVWAILLYPNVDADIPRPKGWGIVPEKDSFRQYLHQDFILEPCMMEDYGKKWIAFTEEQDIVRYEAGEVSE